MSFLFGRTDANGKENRRIKKFFNLLLTIFISVIISILSQSTAPQAANALYFGTGFNATVAGNAAGGVPNGVNSCATDMVVVGVGITVNGNSPGFGVYCRAIGEDGQLVVQDQSSASNTTAVGGGNSKIFCAPGKVVTGISFIVWSNVRIRCATPPLLSDNAQTTWALSATGTEVFTDCSSGVVAGFFTRTGAWTDAIGAYCLPFKLNTLTYDVNGGSTPAPASQTQATPGQLLTTSSSYSGTRTGFTFSGWNTSANGLGTDYATGSTIRPIGATTLYAKWNSTITYNGNTNTGGTVPDPTIAPSSAAVTALEQNSGSLVKTGFTFVGWNTAANGSGTSYIAANASPVTETPYMSFDAANFNDSTNAWTDSSSNARSIPGTAVTNATTGSIRGNPIKVTNTVGTNGSVKSFPVVKGTTADGIVIGNSALSNYTMCYVARFAGTNRGRIFTGTTGNWLSGFYTNATGVAYRNGAFITPQTGINDTNWRIQCDVGGNQSTFRNNGVQTSTVSNNSGTMPADISINLYSSRSAPLETSDWAVAEIVIYDSILTARKIQEVEENFNRKYGITAYTSAINTLNYASTGNITLYAQWNSTITYDGNGYTSATNTIPAATTALGTAANTTLAAQGTLAKTGYTFAGWNTAADGSGTNYASGLTTYQSTGSTTLYAKWSRTITYNVNGANSGTPERATDVFINSTTPTIATFPLVGSMVRTGYTFAGWSTTTTGTALTAPYATSDNATLYARWTANTYNIIYDTSTVTSGTMANTTFTAGTAFTLRANAFVKSGYSFKNWNTAADGLGTTYAGGASLTLYAGLTLYPQWNLLAPGLPTVSVAAGNSEVTVTPTAAANSTTVGPPASMLVTAYNSAGVALSPAKTCTVVSPATTCKITGLTNGTVYQFAATATNATGTSTLGTKVNGTPLGIVVTYNATVNSATTLNGGSTLTLTATYNYPTALTLPAATKTGYIFAGWYTSSASGTLIGAAGASYSPTAAITLYARFSGIVYTISYNGNGSTGGTVPVNGTYENGSASSSKTEIFTYTGTDQTFTVPSDIVGTKEIQVELWGAGGGGANYYNTEFGGAAGGYSQVKISTPTAGEVLKIVVGQGGEMSDKTPQYGGGGPGGNSTTTSPNTFGSSGGGLSGVFTGTTPLVIVGGGGGTSPGTYSGAGDNPGGGGGHNQDGGAGSVTATSGRGGTSSAGGAGATDHSSCTYSGTYVAGVVSGSYAGSSLQGGSGCGTSTQEEGGGGGGGGYFGGGGGGFQISGGANRNGGGGGGSGFLSTTRGTQVSAAVAGGNGVSNNFSYPGGASSPYYVNNAGRGGKGYSSTDTTGGNGLVVLRWVSGTGAYSIGAGPTRVGYTFAGWNTAANGTGTNYAVDDSYSSSANLTLYAQWTATPHTVTYALDSGTSSANTTQLTGKVVGNTVTLPASNTMSRTGFVFGGWSDGTTTYAGGATWTVPASDSNFTLTAQWTTQTLSYSYDLNGATGTAPASGTKTYGQTLVLAPITGITKTGYTFAGWNDGSTTSAAGTSITMTASKVFVAQWSAQSFSISYDGNSSTSGSVTAGSYVAGGVPYAIAANGFTKTGYTFTGWKTAADGSGTAYVVGAGYSTAANLTLYAQWNASTFTITYNANGATGGTVPTAATFTTGVSFTTSTNSGSLIKSGYTFAGWNTTASGLGTAFAVSATLTTTANITLYAQWTIISPTITFNQGTATSTPTVFPANTSAVYGTLYTLPTVDTSTVISSVNYIFTGWSDGTNTYAVGDTYRMGVSNLTFTAQWVAVYTVRYVLNGGTGSAPADVLRTNNFAETLTTATISKDGFTLTGWKDQSGVVIPSTTAGWTISDSSYVAYAQWAAILRTLSFAVNGGSGSEASITGKVIGDLVTLPTPTTTNTGYTFGGWLSGGVTYPAGGTYTVGNSAPSFTAVWIGNTNTITYNGNGATGGTAPANGSHVSGATPTYTVETNSGVLVKTGFTFAGWATAANGGGTSYAEGATGFTTTSDVTLYAKWSAASFAVTYNTDGGSTAPTQANTMYGSTFTLPSAPTKSGNNFLGWETGSGATLNRFAPGSTFTMGSAAVEFIARWDGISYAIGYALSGGTSTLPTQANVSYGGSFTTAATPTKSGFTFTGWSNGAMSINASTSYTNVTDNLTLTAQWTISAPGTPGTPTVAPGNGSATITIAAPSTGGTSSSYTVTASPGGATCTVTSPGTSCTIAPLTNGTAYTFTSTATNSAGSSASASTASAAITPAGLPDAPTGVSGSGLGGSVTIGWSAPSSNGGSAITDYVVQYSVAGSNTWTTFTDGVSTATSATITGLTAGNSYEYRVLAKNVIGTSTASFTSPVIETLPTAPSIASTTAASGQVSVVVTAPTHLGSGTVVNYDVTAYDSTGAVAGSCVATGTPITCAVTGLTNGSAYTFKASVTTSVGQSDDSVASSPSTPAGVASTPSNVSAVVVGGNMSVTFTAPTDNGGAAITSYVVTSSPAGATCTVGANATTYTCTGLTAGTNYSYTVKAVNNKGQSSESLASTAITAVTTSSAPLNVSAIITAGTSTLSAVVSFDPPASNNGSPITSYTVTASPGGATCTVAAPTQYCEITGLADNTYTFTVTATNSAGTSAASVASASTAATNGIAPTLVVDPPAAAFGDKVEAKVLTSGAAFNSLPNPVITYVWKRCTDATDPATCITISGATASTYTLTSSDVGKFIRVETTATNSSGSTVNLSEATTAITAAPTQSNSTPSIPSTPSAPAGEPAPSVPTCDSACQAIRDAAATKAAADAAAKVAADKAAADAAAKLKADSEAVLASSSAKAAAAAAATAAKTAVEKAAAAEAAKIAADAAAAAAAAKAKVAADAQAAANKAAADASAALKSSTATAATKAAATASANKAAADAAAAVSAAAAAAKQSATAKTTATNATKQVEIAINSLNSKTAASQASAQANAIAAAAKAAANEAAAAAAAKAAEAKTIAATAQKAAADTAAKIATEQKEAATAAATAKSLADAAAKATAEKIAATTAAKTASETLLKVLDEKAALAEQVVKATDDETRAAAAEKLKDIESKAVNAQKAADVATANADKSVNDYEAAIKVATDATKVADEQAAQAVAAKSDAATQAVVATKAAAAATVAAKVATAAAAAAAKVPSKAVITAKPSTTTTKNSATATVTGLKPGQKVKVTVNVKPKP